MARISELENLNREPELKYENATKGFIPLNQVNTVYLFKSLSKTMKKALRSHYSSYKEDFQ